MFELTREEYTSLRSQIVILERGKGQHSKMRIDKLEDEMHIKVQDSHQALSYLLESPNQERSPVGFKQKNNP